ncbi:MAG: InlB B-repeat-containing protein [Lachnospiraceae bacterium]|nr:InlB B-repeat-containing protein [Lachnospiraceae bacterium]
MKRNAIYKKGVAIIICVAYLFHIMSTLVFAGVEPMSDPSATEWGTTAPNSYDEESAQSENSKDEEERSDKEDKYEEDEHNEIADDSQSENSKEYEEENTEESTEENIEDREEKEDREDKEEKKEKEDKQKETDQKEKLQNEEASTEAEESVSEDEAPNEAPHEVSYVDRAIDAVIYKNSDYSPIEEGMREYEAERNTEITLSGVMPDNAYSKAYPVQLELTDKNVIAAYDITIFYENENGEEVVFNPNDNENSDKIRVDITNDAIKEAIEDERDLSVYHAENEFEKVENIEKLDDKKNDIDNSGDTVSFDAECFSVYAVVDDRPALRTYEFYTVSTDGVNYVPYYFEKETGELICKQSIKSGDELIIPQLPASNTKTFAGWYVYNQDTDTYSDDTFDFENIPEITVSETVILRARFESYAYVIFHEQYNGVSGTWPIIETKRVLLDVTGHGTAKIDDVSATYDSGDENEQTVVTKLFEGWSPVLLSNIEADRAQMIASDSITVTGNIDLYPVFNDVHWLSFWSGPVGSGATYIAAKYFYDSETATAADLAVPTLKGHSFEGWYTASGNSGVKVTDENLVVQNGVNEAGITTANGKISLANDATLYAHWSASDTTYTVIIWRESIKDTLVVNGNNYSVPNKTYDFAESYTIQATSGTLVTESNEYKNKGNNGNYKGFYYSTVSGDFTRTNPNNAITVRSDGSSIINYYYDRYYAVYIFKYRSGSRWTEDQSLTCKGLYGQTLSTIGKTWPVNDKVCDTYDQNKPSGTQTTYLDSLNAFDDINPDGNTLTRVFYCANESGYYTYNIHYVRQSLEGNYTDGEIIDCDIKSSYSSITFYVTDKFMGFKAVGYSKKNLVEPGNSGFTETHAGESFSSSDRNIYVYFERLNYNLSFIDSYDNSEISTVTVPYGDDLSKYIPATNPTPRSEGKEFGGWYCDSSCVKGGEFDFTLTMPLNNLAAYAKWNSKWYLIEIDPNGGELADGDSTWFWEEYYGDKVIEYTKTTRNYTEALNGNYYYHINLHEDLGIGKEYDSVLESGSRKAYYTKDINDATDLTRSYVSANGAYKYAGWYEVFDDGREELYNFDSEITHNLYLRLHWKEVGTYYLRYDAGAGSLDENDSNEDTFKVLDEADYADNSNVIVNRIAYPARGYDFIGWKIRNDSSGKIYYPGDTFRFQSKYTIANSSGNKYMILDAVYSKIATITLTYDANGGEVNAGTVDFGTVSSNVSHETTEGTASVIGLSNNEKIDLSTGAGFSYGNMVFKGWNSKPDYTGTHYEAGGTYRIDTIGSNTLYAEWETKVYFDVNNENAGWDTSTINYLTEESHNVYSAKVLIHKTVSQPGVDPIVSALSGSEDLFGYWSTVRYTDDPEKVKPFDFSKAIEGETTLYGYWTSPIQVPIHAVDASEETLVDKTSAWIKSPGYLEVNNHSVYNLADTMMDAQYVNIPNDYTAEFACIKARTEEITGDNVITEISYNLSERCVQIKRTDGTYENLKSEDEIFFVYYKNVKTVNIGYKYMSVDDGLVNASVKSAAISNTQISNSPYAMASNIDAKTWNNGLYSYYSYAIGNKNAADVDDIHYITDTVAINSSTRPVLRVRNTWRGYEYTFSSGDDSWNDCGYDIQLYVIYFMEKPTLVTIGEDTVGTRADDAREFSYEVVIKQTRKVVSSTTTEVARYNITLKDGQTETFTIFYWTEWFSTTKYSQTITITQTAVDGFTTDNTGITRTNNHTATYTTVQNGINQTVTYTNTHTPLSVELHTARVVNGQIIADDSLRTDNSSTYTISIPITQSVDITESNPDIFTGNASEYRFAGIIYGTCSDNVVTENGSGVTSIRYKKMTDSEYYELCINDDEDRQLADNDIYYVYSELPKVYYMKKDSKGHLSQIDNIRRNGAEVSLNGETVVQGKIINIGNAEFTIANGGAGSWHFPPNLDGSSDLSLKYLEIGVGAPGATSIEGLQLASTSLKIKAESSNLKYKMDNAAEWNNFEDRPTVYIIYNEPASYIKIQNNTSNDYRYRLTIYSGAYKEDILRKDGAGTQVIEVTENQGGSPYYDLSIAAGAAETLCIFNAVDMSYYVQVIDGSGNVIRPEDYLREGITLEDDSDPEFGTLIMGPEFDGEGDSFAEAETSKKIKCVSYADDEFIPAMTLYSNRKEPFALLIILALVLGISTLLIKVRKDQ